MLKRITGLPAYFLIAAIVLSLVYLSFHLSLFTGPERFLEDRLFSSGNFSSEIVIVSVDDESIKEIGQWPWKREVFAQAIERMNAYPPRALGIDAIFSESSRYGLSDDNFLKWALNSAGFPVILPVEGRNLERTENGSYRISEGIFPLSDFRSAKSVALAHVNLLLDRDGVVRMFPYSISGDNGANYTAFSAEVLKRGNYNFNENDYSGSPRIVFKAETGGIRHISFSRLLKDEEALQSIKGKIVLIGATAPDLHDEKPTPLGSGTEMPGVEIQANIANMILSGEKLSPAPPYAYLLLLVLLAFLPAFLFARTRKSSYAASISLVLGVSANVLSIVFFERGTILNIVHLNLTWLLSAVGSFSYRYFLSERGRKELRNIFGKYVSPSVLESILANPDKITLGGEEKTVTVLFSDIRGFTTLSEKTTPKELVYILNKYFTLMTGEVLSHGGVLDKYIGDAVMAFWGAPLSDDKQADNAYLAALGMLEKLKIFNQELKKEKGIEINIGIGLYTGPAVVGNIGSEQRFDYTVMGDTVNVASRLEGLNKEYKTNLIVGEPTKNSIKAAVNWKNLGETTVKGRAEALKIYTIG